MEIRPVTAAPGLRGLDALAATAAPAPVERVPNALDPPVTLDIGKDADKGAGTSPRDARFVRDSDTRAMVFQVVDPASGDVVVQSPTETVLRNRAYEAAARAHAGQVGAAARVA